MIDPQSDQTLRRILAFLSQGDTTVGPAADAVTVLLTNCGRTVGFRLETVQQLQRSRLIKRRGGSIELTPAGRKMLVANSEDADRFVTKHRNLGTRIFVEDGETSEAAVNLDESPLASLMRRRGVDGKPYLAGKEFAAGERLRSDYTRANIMPRLSANWEASIASKGRGNGRGVGDLTDAALAARQRVDRALTEVGPELSGVLVDVCCFLKGLERVEQERSWPVRSGKLVLKTALAVLSRHYAPNISQKGTPTLHWGANDYRPAIRSRQTP